jgi:hypothetical protein
MKTKKGVSKKLVLKKRTIIDLNDKDLSKVMGGIITYERTICRTECVTECPRCPSELCM